MSKTDGRGPSGATRQTEPATVAERATRVVVAVESPPWETQPDADETALELAPEPVIEEQTEPPGAEPESVALPSLGEARAANETWTRARLELEGRVDQLEAESDTIAATLSAARRDAILAGETPKARASIAKLVARQRAIEAERTELTARVAVARESEAEAARIHQAAGIAHAFEELRTKADALVARAAESNARLDASFRAALEELHARWELGQEADALAMQFNTFVEQVSRAGIAAVPFSRLPLERVRWDPAAIPSLVTGAIPRHFYLEL